MASDAFPVKIVDDFLLEVECKTIQIGGENFDIGANPSAEEADEGVDSSVETANNGNVNSSYHQWFTHSVSIRRVLTRSPTPHTLRAT